jgi:hypothetical protein
VLLVDGYLYQLEAHLERFKASAELAGLPLPMSEERLLRILMDTAAASMKMNGEGRGVNTGLHHELICPHLCVCMCQCAVVSKNAGDGEASSVEVGQPGLTAVRQEHLHIQS